MKILFLSFYYSPDLCPGSFRASALVKALKEEAPNCEIDVITTLPNRYASFSTDALLEEESNGVRIKRIPLPKHKSGMKDQSKAFFQYARAAKDSVKSEDYDLVFATSSRLMTAALGSYISRKKKIPLYLDIRDIFVDTIIEVLPRLASALAQPFLTLLETWVMTRARRINLVSQGFEHYFRKRYPLKELSFFTNGIDEEFIVPISHETNPPPSDAVLNVVYAGNIGDGQGLDRILPELAQRTEGKLNFKIFGDGSQKNALTDALSRQHVKNVEIMKPISRGDLISEYTAADILFLHLNNYKAFKKVLPSKIFEYAALGKPIWAGLPGFSAHFLEKEVDNVAIFEPCDVKGAAEKLEGLAIRTKPRPLFIEKYRRSSICRLMAKDILSLAATKGR